jgi:hypothetical protein
MFIKHLKNKVMDNKKIIIIGGTSIIVIGLLYFAFKKANQKDITNDPQLKADFESVIKKIDNAKK